MTTKTKARCMTVLIVLATAVLFAGACYRAEQSRQSAAITASCTGAHCNSMFNALR